MTKRWYHFTDETQTKIDGSYASKQDASHEPQEELEESDPRVQEFLGPQWARAAYQEFVVESAEEFFRIATRINVAPRMAWRGQPDASWPLTTDLERERDETILKEIGLHVYESRILTVARRRAHHHHADHPQPDDLLGWLAFLRHEGVPTRLLDVTWSPFIASFFAVSPELDARDGAVWAFNQSQLYNGLHNALMNCEKPFFRGGGVVLDSYQPPTPELPAPERMVTDGRPLSQNDLVFGSPLLLLDLATRGALAVQAVLLVEPGRWMSRRHDVQQGAFIVPLNLRSGFQRNLEEMIGQPMSGLANGGDAQPFPLNDKHIETVTMNAAVIKLRIRAATKSNLRGQLHKMNIRASVLFPDRHGFALELRNLVPPKGTWPTS